MRASARWLEWVLVAAAMLAAVPIVRAAAAHLRARAMQRELASGRRSETDTREQPRAAAVKTGDVLGELRIPSAELAVPVVEGCTPSTLDAGACRMAETAQIGGLGTVAIAGHRDSAFRALSRVRQGDPIRIVGAHGTAAYLVESSRIVAPQQVEVLNTARRPQLVLITCYPFGFVGSAPQRFVVQARLQSVEPFE